MKIDKNELPKKQIELAIELSQDEIKPYLEKAAEKLSLDKPLKGFRPGKAPFDVCVREYGEMSIYQTASNDIIAENYYRAIEQEKLETVDQPKIDIVKMAPNNPFVFKATVALLPKVELPEYQTIKVKKLSEITVEEKEIEKVIEDLRKMRAKEALVDREAKQGDRVEIDFNTFIDKVPIEKGAAQKYPIIIGENKMIPGFEEKLIGMKKDEEKEFELEFPKDYHQKSVANKLAKFKVKMLAVYQIDLPELNEEFAKSMGLPTIEAFKNQIKQNLTDEKKNKQVQKQELEIIEQLIEKAVFEEIPDVLIDQETHKMLHELENNVTKQGLNFQEYLKHMKKSEADLRLDFAKDAIKRVKTALAIRAIAQKEDIQATKKEIEQEQEKTLASYKLHPQYQTQIEQLEKNIKSENAARYFKNVIANQKVIGFLKKNVTIA